MKKHNAGLLGVLLLLSTAVSVDAIAQSDSDNDNPPPPPKRASRQRARPADQYQQQAAPAADATAKPVSLAIMGGLSSGAGSSYTVTTPSGATPATSDSTSSGGFIGAEVAYTFIDFLAAGIEVQRSSYSYQNTAISSDGEISFLVFPKVQYDMDSFRFWGSLGLGLTITTIGSTNTSVSPFIAGANSSTAGFTISPRIGADYKITDQFFAGAFVGYLNTRGNVSTPAISSTINGAVISAQTTESFTRTWYELGLRVGMYF